MGRGTLSKHVVQWWLSLNSSTGNASPITIRDPLLRNARARQRARHRQTTAALVRT